MLRTPDYSPTDTLLWLQHLDIFSDVPAEELALLLDGMAWVEIRGGDTLGAEDDEQYVYIVRYGSLGSTLQTGALGGDVELAPIGPGEILGEISVIANIRRPTKVVALRHCGLLKVRAAWFSNCALAPGPSAQVASPSWPWRKASI
jgi:CRP-like cAMP-binding protein